MTEPTLLTAPRVVGVGLKMYLDHPSTLAWLTRVADVAREHPAIRRGDVALFALPSFPALVEARSIVEGTGIEIGAQDIAAEDAGPWTGEVSGIELEQIGCAVVEVGHAERRRHFGEDDATVSRKLAAALRNGIIPVLCLGEWEPTDAASAADFCIGQLRSAIEESLDTGVAGPIIVAYEPVWAIGAPAPAPAEHVVIVGNALRSALAQQPELAGSRVIYGGSAGDGLFPSVADGVDGLFLGRAVHDVAVLARVLDEAAELTRR